MAEPQEKLAESLDALYALQTRGLAAIRSRGLSRTHRERLVKAGFLNEVIKGWYVPSRPDETPGDSTAWYASFWDFCGAYLSARFGRSWCLSPEQSLLLHAGKPHGADAATGAHAQGRQQTGGAAGKPQSHLHPRNGRSGRSANSTSRCRARRFLLRARSRRQPMQAPAQQLLQFSDEPPPAARQSAACRLAQLEDAKRVQEIKKSSP